VITGHQPEIWTFLLSFVVIIRLWLPHHKAYQHVRAYSTPLMLCNSAWLLAIVVLPFLTEMVAWRRRRAVAEAWKQAGTVTPDHTKYRMNRRVRAGLGDSVGDDRYIPASGDR
jgi:uncharacterized membrane protein